MATKHRKNQQKTEASYLSLKVTIFNMHNERKDEL